MTETKNDTHSDSHSRVIELAVLSAGVTSPSMTGRLAENLAQATATHLADSGLIAELKIVELRHLAVDLARTLTEPGFCSTEVKETQALLARCDGLIACTPVYSAGCSGLFKLFFDLLDQRCLSNRPTVIGATAGSMRHMLVLEHSVRPLLTFLHAPVMPTGVFATRTDCMDEHLPRLDARIDRAGQELALAIAAKHP